MPILEGILHLFARRPPKDVLIDVLDLVIVTYVVYRALLVLRGTRAMQMGTGLGVIFLVYVVSKWAGFITLFNLLSTLLSSIILIVVVVFQNDIRRGLMRVGSRAFLGGISRQQESRVIDEVVAASTELARHRTGALICFEQDANLDEFVVSQGTVLDSVVQRELLVTLFFPDMQNKLHDGAVIIRNLRVAKAGVFFPMPDTKVLDKSLGSRHRAALGITEETDAVVVVVSEERGSISVCFHGNIIPHLDGASLRQVLLGLFGQRTRKKKSGPKGKISATQTGTFRITVPPPSPGAPVGAVTHVTPVPVPPLGAPPIAPPISVSNMPSSIPPPSRAVDSVPAHRMETPPTRPMMPARPVDRPTLTGGPASQSGNAPPRTTPLPPPPEPPDGDAGANQG